MKVLKDIFRLSIKLFGFNMIDEDMTSMDTVMVGEWHGVLQGHLGCPNQEGGPRLIRFESPRWRPKETKVRVHLGVQKQLALKSTPRPQNGVRFLCYLYGWEDNFKDLSMALV